MMIKKNIQDKLQLFLFMGWMFISISMYAQVGIGTSTPAKSAALEVSAVDKGFLPPRLTQQQRNGIINPAAGLVVWCTDCGLTGQLSVFNGAAWINPAGQRSGRNYYVSEHGNDENDGLLPSRAWQTLRKVNESMPGMSPGDSILFEKGSHFFGTLEVGKSGTAENPIVFGSYGSETQQPLFIGAVTILSDKESIPDMHATWQYAGNDNWEYKDDVTNGNKVDIANLVLREKAATKDSFGIKLMSYDSTLLNRQGQFWYSYFSRSFRLHSVGDPRNFYSSIQMVLSINAIEFKGNAYLVFENLDFRYYGKCVVEKSGNYCSFRNLNISYIGGADHSDTSDATAKHYQERYGNGLQVWNAGHDITITGCRIDNVYDAGISPQGISDTFKAVCNDTLVVYNIYMRNNVITNCEYSFEFFENVSKNCRLLPHNVHDIYFENNTCVNAGGGWSHYQRWAYIKWYPDPQKTSRPNPDGTNFRIERLDAVTSNTPKIFIRNNIFCGATEKLFWVLDSSFLNKYVSDYNDFWQVTDELMDTVPVGSFSGYNYPQTTYFGSLSEWQAHTGQEQHSFNLTPLFISSTDFHLQSFSPLIGKGIDVGYGKYLGAYPLKIATKK